MMQTAERYGGALRRRGSRRNAKTAGASVIVSDGLTSATKEKLLGQLTYRSMPLKVLTFRTLKVVSMLSACNRNLARLPPV